LNLIGANLTLGGGAAVAGSGSFRTVPGFLLAVVVSLSLFLVRPTP
jgi:hypothetical protein